MSEQVSCSFCGKDSQDALILVAGLNAHICEVCVEKAQEIVDDQLWNASESDLPEGAPSIEQLEDFNEDLKPKDIKAHLDEYIIGQDDAKKLMSVAVYNHYKRLMSNTPVELEKSNLLFVGPTGTGKTLMARTIARLLNVPFTIVDATVFTEAGYVGEDVESILSRLLQACDYNVKLAERGIVYIDEVDKVARRSDNPSLTRDVSGEGVQQAMLKLLEGADINVPPHGGRKHPDQKMIKVNTRHILFICGGAFSGIEKIIARRLNTRVIGFNDTKARNLKTEDILPYITHRDLRAFGLIPELIGRLPVLAHLKPLDKEDLKRILVEPKNALTKQYETLFGLENIELKFTKEAIDYIAEQAIIYELGARGLRSICEAIMTDAMYETPSAKVDRFVVDKKYAVEQLQKANLSIMQAA